ncbi:dihydroorotate dehydrogenase [Rhodoferax ferrireducens]|uniref:dihydroorotate dehydrogenase n=1 Tax=Rhodoferax ferrireducens TaxID=192843 RepID=UPI000E0D361A|nr:dihydroorotate dehydrogenase [Rhodoferax ferrireducens]
MSACRLRLGSERPGLAGGIDRDGSRAAELLAAGFGSVEFGTVTPEAEPGRQPGVAVLAQRLAGLGRPPDHQNQVLIGIGLGLGQGAALTALAAHWLAGLKAAWPVADYLSFNLSAAAYRPLLAPEHAVLLADALATVARERQRLTADGRRHVALALKLPLEAQPLSTAAQMALAAGFDAVVAVLPQRPERLDWLQAWARRINGAAQLVAVGGMRTSADVRAALGAGASGIQVHSVFVEQGSACLPPLLAGLAAAHRAGLGAHGGS